MWEGGIVFTRSLPTFSLSSKQNHSSRIAAFKIYIFFRLAESMEVAAIVKLVFFIKKKIIVLELKECFWYLLYFYLFWKERKLHINSSKGVLWLDCLKIWENLRAWKPKMEASSSGLALCLCTICKWRSMVKFKLQHYVMSIYYEIEVNYKTDLVWF